MIRVSDLTSIFEWRGQALYDMGRLARYEGEEVVSDYRAMGHTLNRHPLALVRPHLAARRFELVCTLATYQNRQLARGCGIVIVRQRPRPTA
ncbi:hypothetical protein [Cupriavidus basilensis]|uniref:hypothetical protein n=1 Tax=Cupriavidus basilensis TaxID=68895 RepID=UPI00157AE0B0|nr:hypothetical protein [Cupriavidus basilensis]NUA27288.1 hypothetical protein [Cupriavidus basilensis]